MLTQSSLPSSKGRPHTQLRQMSVFAEASSISRSVVDESGIQPDPEKVTARASTHKCGRNSTISQNS